MTAVRESLAIEHDLRPLEVQDHVKPVIAIHVFETERDRHQVSVGPVEPWTKVDACVGSPPGSSITSRRPWRFKAMK